MTRAELLKATEQETGVSVTGNNLLYAIETGRVPRPSKRGGWFAYGKEHLESFVEYIKNDSHVGMRSGAAQ